MGIEPITQTLLRFVAPLEHVPPYEEEMQLADPVLC